MSTSASTQAALKRLQKIKPSDGWATESRSTGSGVNVVHTVRLLRRNVPLTDSYFLDLHYDTESGNVVGILTPNRDGRAQAQILVDEKGTPQGRKTALLRVSNWTPGASTERSSFSSTSRSSTRAAADTSTGTLSLEENKELLKYVAYAIGSALAFRMLFSAMFGLYVLAFPIVYLYLLQNCPKVESFNAKKELKRVLRGVHLPDDDPNKPKGFMSETFARINATLTTELATGFGYEIEMFPLAGAAYVATVRVPASKMECYWVGACNRWYFVYSRELPNAN